MLLDWFLNSRQRRRNVCGSVCVDRWKRFSAHRYLHDVGFRHIDASSCLLFVLLIVLRVHLRPSENHRQQEEPDLWSLVFFTKHADLKPESRVLMTRPCDSCFLLITWDQLTGRTDSVEQNGTPEFCARYCVFFQVCTSVLLSWACHLKLTHWGNLLTFGTNMHSVWGVKRWYTPIWPRNTLKPTYPVPSKYCMCYRHGAELQLDWKAKA